MKEWLFLAGLFLDYWKFKQIQACKKVPQEKQKWKEHSQSSLTAFNSWCEHYGLQPEVAWMVMLEDLSKWDHERVWNAYFSSF